MPIRRRAVAVTVAILSFAGVAHAQTDVVSLLKSRDPRLQAWGAWYVGVGQLRELVPMVQDLVLEQLRVPGTSNLTLDVAVDALIQTQSPVHAGQLPDLYAVRPAQALILSSFAGDDGEPFLRAVLATSKGHDWFAAANLLLARRSSTLAADLLSSLRLKVKVHVVDRGVVGGGEGGAVAVGCGAGGPRVVGMPPIAAYALTSFAHSGVTILATGPTSIYYRRTVLPSGQVAAPSTTYISGPTGDDRVLYLAALTGLDAKSLPVRGYEQHSVSVKEHSNVEAEVARIRADVTERFARFLAILAEQRVLPPDVRTTVPPPIDVEIEDHRRSATR